MTNHRCRRWFQLSLKSLFLLTLLVATFFAGCKLATKRAEEAIRMEREIRQAAELRAALTDTENQRLHALFRNDHDLKVWQAILSAAIALCGTLSTVPRIIYSCTWSAGASKAENVKIERTTHLYSRVLGSN